MAVIGGVLLHLGWQGALVGVATALALRLASPAASRVRYGLAIGALALIAAAPIVTAARRAGMLERWGLAGAGTREQVAESPAGATIPTPPPANAAHGQRTASPDTVPGAGEFAGRGPIAWLAVLWLAGVVVLLGRLVGGLAQVHRLRAEASPAPDSLRIAQHFARLMGVHRGVAVLVSDRADVPFVTGIRHPAIVLPSGLAAALSPEQIRVVLAHELAHVRRHDYAVNLGQRVLEALFFFHPAVHWVSAVARDEREHCCDELAARAVGDRRAVAGALLALEEARPIPSLLPAAAGGRLLGRVERLLAAVPSGRPRWAVAAAAVLLGGGASMVLATPVTSDDAPDVELNDIAMPVTQPAVPAASPPATESVAPVVWSGTLRPGDRLRARNIVGPIRVVRGAGSTAVVRARLSDALSDLSFEATREDDGVTVCALRADYGRCDAEGYTWFGESVEMRRTRIELTVELPPGVSVTAATFEGDLDLDAVDADAEARTGSGAIAARIIEALEPRSNRSLDLHTGAGTVRVALPAAFGGELEARLSGGRIVAEPPLGASDAMAHRVRTSLGPGGNRLSVSSGSGDLVLSRR